MVSIPQIVFQAISKQNVPTRFIFTRRQAHCCILIFIKFGIFITFTETLNFDFTVQSRLVILTNSLFLQIGIHFPKRWEENQLKIAGFSQGVFNADSSAHKLKIVLSKACCLPALLAHKILFYKYRSTSFYFIWQFLSDSRSFLC